MVAKLKAAAANPVNPTFNHYMFETIAALVKNVCSVHSSADGGVQVAASIAPRPAAAS